MDENIENEQPLLSLAPDILIRKWIEHKDTHHVIVWGSSYAGKTALVGSLLYYMNMDNPLGHWDIAENNFYNVPVNQRLTYSGTWREIEKTLTESEKIFRDVAAMLEQNVYPQRTPINLIFEKDVLLRPKKSYLPSLKTTFLDMQGEYWDLFTKSPDELQPDIREFMQKLKIILGSVNHDLDIRPKIAFLLTVPHTEAKFNDGKVVDFIDSLLQMNKDFAKAPIALILTKWDMQEYNHQDFKGDVNAFLRKNMPLTYQKLKVTQQSCFPYTIGKQAVSVQGSSAFLTFDMNSPANIWKYLYHNFTGKKIDKSSWLF